MIRNTAVCVLAALWLAVLPACRSSLEKQRQSMTSVFVLAGGISAFLEENPEWQPIHHGHFVVADEMQGLLVGPFLSEQGWLEAKTDGWGNPLLIWVDEAQFAVVSLGQDGSPDWDYYSMENIHKDIPMSVHSEDPDLDIVHFGDTTFYQFPVGFEACCLPGGNSQINDGVRARFRQ